jgi:hypothetical protein
MIGAVVAPEVIISALICSKVEAIIICYLGIFRSKSGKLLCNCNLQDVFYCIYMYARFSDLVLFDPLEFLKLGKMPFMQNSTK